MLLDYGSSWLMGIRELGCNPLPRSGGAATLPELFIAASRSAKRSAKGA